MLLVLPPQKVPAVNFISIIKFHVVTSIKTSLPPTQHLRAPGCSIKITEKSGILVCLGYDIMESEVMLEATVTAAAQKLG